MKKFAVFVAAVIILTVAAPVLAANSTFKDIPANHWALDAVTQLAARGIITGYEDGVDFVYRGQQNMTRYEIAILVQRALSSVNTMSASNVSKQDTDMLKKLVIEFKDELDALGMRVDALEKGAGNKASGGSGMGGWKISGRLRFDVDYRMRNEGWDYGLGAAKEDGARTGMFDMGLHDARMNFDRVFGEDDKAFFRMQIRNRTARWDSAGTETTIHYFYAKIPFVMDSFLSVGWFGDDQMGRRFNFVPDKNGRYGALGIFNDDRKPMLMFQKAFELGNFTAFISHPGAGTGLAGLPGLGSTGAGTIPDAFEAFFDIDLKPNEKFGVGLGAQYLKVNDWRVSEKEEAKMSGFDSAFTGWFGLDFNFVQGAALHGMIYFQSKSAVNEKIWAHVANWGESANMWRVALDVKQDVLQFSSFWAEYGRVGQYFWAPEGMGYNAAFIVKGDSRDPGDYFAASNFATNDIKFWKVGAAQDWTDQFRTWLFYVKAGFSDVAKGENDGYSQIGVGMDYAYNSYTVFSLNWMQWKNDEDDDKYSRLRFTTQISF